MSKQHSHSQNKKETSGVKFLKEKQKSAAAQNRFYGRKRLSGQDASRQALPAKAVWILIIFILVAVLAVIFFVI
jgi:hypothetical protein